VVSTYQKSTQEKAESKAHGRRAWNPRRKTSKIHTGCMEGKAEREFHTELQDGPPYVEEMALPASISHMEIVSLHGTTEKTGGYR